MEKLRIKTQKKLSLIHNQAKKERIKNTEQVSQTANKQ